MNVNDKVIYNEKEAFVKEVVKVASGHLVLWFMKLVIGIRGFIL